MSEEKDKKETEEQHDEITGKAVDMKLLKRLLIYAKPYKWWLLLAVLLTVGMSAFGTVRPYLTKITVDNYIANKDALGLRNMILLILGSIILQGLLQYGMTYLTQWIGQKVIYDLRMQLFEHVQKMSMSFFDKNPVGRLVTRLTSDIEVLNEMFSSGIVMIFADVFTIAGILFFMFSLSWQLSLISLSVLIPLVYATLVFRKKVRVVYRDTRKILARMNSFLQEHITGMLVIKIFSNEKKTFEEFKNINAEFTVLNKRSVFLYSVFYPIVELIGAISVALIIWYGGANVISGVLTIGILISFLQYSEMFFRPIRDLSEKYNILQTAMASSERVFNLLDNQTIIPDPENPVKPKEFRGHIEFRNVWFAYNKDNYVLRDVSFEIKPGEKFAVVGATGAGKTSLMNLLCRFYDVQKGEILLDGVNIKDMTQEDLRKNIGLVIQDIFLFSDSVKNNISLNNKDITNEKIKEAVRIIGIENFINYLPEKFEQNVKERGVTLSQGQRQLITFARALAYEPKILILDEATSSVDTHSEMLIQNAIEKLMHNRTSIIIAHRLSTIKMCDKIIVMHKGELREIGSHYELIAIGGIYSKLYQLQYKETMAK